MRVRRGLSVLIYYYYKLHPAFFLSPLYKMMLLVRRDAPIVAEKMAVAMSPFSFTPSLQMPFFKDKGLRTDSFINGFSCHCACARLGKQGRRRASGLCFLPFFIVFI